MAITVRWADDAQTIIHYEYVGRWTWDEYRLANDEAVRLAQTVGRSVSVIGDFRQSNFVPDAALSGFRRSLTHSRLQIDVIVLLLKSEFIQRMLDIFRRVNSKQASGLLTAHDLDEALALIATHQTHVAT